MSVREIYASLMHALETETEEWNIYKKRQISKFLLISCNKVKKFLIISYIIARTWCRF